MRVEFRLESKPAVKGIGDAIYRCLEASDRDYCKEIHNIGKKHTEGRNGRTASWIFKPFCYSHPYVTKEGYAVKIASPDPKFWYHLIRGKNILNAGTINKHTYSRACHTGFIRAGSNMALADLFMLSPLVIRARNETGYLDNLDDLNLVNELIEDNLFRKQGALYGVKADKAFFKIQEIKNVVRKDKRYKGENIPAFYLNMRVMASLDMFSTALDMGIGSKNALGFGMIEVSKNKKEDM